MVPVVAAEEAEHPLVPVVEQQPRRRKGPAQGSQNALVGKKKNKSKYKKINIKKTNQNIKKILGPDAPGLCSEDRGW